MSDVKKTFLEAKSYYDKGEYDKAIGAYETLLSDGFKSGNLYYNLGNCYLKKKSVSKAIINYERAERIIPRDSDLAFNLVYARSLMKQQDLPVTTNILIAALIRAGGHFTLQENIKISFALYYGIIFLAVLMLFFRSTRWYLIPVTVLMLIILLSESVPIVYGLQEVKRAAIVTAAITDARFEPLKDANVHFPLYEGMKIYVLREKGEWLRVKRPDGRIGWVEGAAVELVGS